jgi:hypothetical protein
MNSRLALCLVTALAAGSAHAQDGPPALMWAREYFPERIATFKHVVETSDGGYAVAAAVPGTNGNNRPIIRFDQDGDMLWYSGNAFYAQSGQWVEELPDHGFLVTGGVVLAAGESDGLYLVRVDSSGVIIWAKAYDSTEYDEKGLCAALLPDGGFAVCGYWSDHLPWLLRTDAAGDTLWTRVWETGWAYARRVVYYDNGLTVFVDGGYGYGPLLLRYDMDGNLQWVSNFTGEFLTSTELGGSMCLTPGGGRYTFVSDWKSWIVGTNEQGVEGWRWEVEGTSGRLGLSLDATMDGGYVLSGRGSYWDPPVTWDMHTVPADTGTTWDGWLVKMDSLGQDQWHIYNSQGARDNYFNSVCQLSQGGYIVAGQIMDPSGGSNFNGYLLRYAPETGIEGGEFSQVPLSLFPSCNPFTSSVTITCSGSSLPGQLMVYDLAGRLIRSLSDRQGSSFLWDGRDATGADVPPGTYLIQGAIDGQVSSIRVVKL